MTTRTIVKRKAVDLKHGMDWFEVAQFAHAVDDMAQEAYNRSGSATVTPVHCTVNMRGGIKELSVEVTTDD